MGKSLDDDFYLDDEFEGDMITVVGSAFYQPIADLIDKLSLYKARAPSRLGVGYFENGYSVSIVVLLVLAFESYVTRVHFLRSKSHIDPGQRKKSTVSYLLSLDAAFPYRDQLSEVYVIRDALAHAHLWHVNYVTRRDRVDIKNQKLFNEYGDGKMASRVNLTDGVTKKLRLQVVPTSIGVREVAAVFRVVDETLKYLVKVDLLEAASINGQVKYGGRNREFWSLGTDLSEIFASQAVGSI